ncbi:MAG: ATP-dependent Clp protease ATP-binding subunit, partial [Clostridia bacterium]|nr:ATP-dependent Clp protease ATP-binding subunit [Clostridia bacterium]
DIDLPEVDDEEPSEELVSESKIRSITARVRKIQKKLLENVYGQDHAVAMLASGYFRGELASVADSDSTKPRATYLFAGPPGVGKTYLAKCAAAELGLPFCRFDMSEYCDKESALEFLGSDKVYQNAGEGNFTSFVEKNHKCVILFDEIEKAHSSIINLFLQILDAGRIRDSYTDREISLKDAVLIFTTNAGKDLYDAESAFDGSAIPKKAILSALGSDRDKVSGEPYFPAAICSRFAGSNVVMFNRMKAADLWKIAERAIRNGIANLKKEFGINVELDENVISAVLFAAGGLADARTVESQAVAFLHDELLELFRLADARDGEDGRQVSDITDIKISVDLSEADEIIKNLFKPKEKPEILAFGCEDSVFALDICNVIPADTACKAREILKKENVTLTLINVGQDGERGEEEYLSPEDGCC